MLLYFQSNDDPHLEVWYSGSLKRLEQAIGQKFTKEDNKSSSAFLQDSTYIFGPISKPLISGSEYTLYMKVMESNKSGHLIAFRLINNDPEFNLLSQQRGTFRNSMDYLQEVIDVTLNAKYSSRAQEPYHMYLHVPNQQFQNLYSYLYTYSLEELDTTVKQIAYWLVYACETPRQGSWINDSTFRIDNLRQPAFGINGSFSLTIEYSKVEKGYMQYLIYTSNYSEERPENNYEIRYHDLHRRLWRYYNTLLNLQASGRR